MLEIGGNGVEERVPTRAWMGQECFMEKEELTEALPGGWTQGTACQVCVGGQQAQKLNDQRRKVMFVRLEQVCTGGDFLLVSVQEGGNFRQWEVFVSFALFFEFRLSLSQSPYLVGHSCGVLAPQEMAFQGQF